MNDLSIQHFCVLVNVSLLNSCIYAGTTIHNHAFNLLFILQ